MVTTVRIMRGTTDVTSSVRAFRLDRSDGLTTEPPMDTSDLAIYVSWQGTEYLVAGGSDL